MSILYCPRVRSTCPLGKPTSLVRSEILRRLKLVNVQRINQSIKTHLYRTSESDVCKLPTTDSKKCLLAVLLLLLLLTITIQYLYSAMNRDHSFPRKAEFWAEPRNLPISVEFLWLHGILPNSVVAFGKGTNMAYFGRVQAAILYVHTILSWNTWLPLVL